MNCYYDLGEKCDILNTKECEHCTMCQTAAERKLRDKYYGDYISSVRAYYDKKRRERIHSYKIKKARL